MMNTGGFFKIAIEKINKRWNKSIEEVIEQYNISRGELITLNTIKKYSNEITLKELTNKLFFDKSHTSRNVNSLISKELIKKVFKDGYKTKYSLALTQNGEDIVNKSKHLQDTTKNELLSKLTKEELETFKNLLIKLTDD